MGLTLTLIWGIALVIGAIIATVRLRGSVPCAASLPRGLVLLLPFAAAIMLWVMGLNILATPFEEWNAARVAPVVAWWQGLPLYYPPGEGPGTAFIYPPVSAILRLPVGLSGSPTIAIIASSFLNLLVYHIPLLLFIRQTRASCLMGAIGLLAIWGFSLDMRSLNYSAYWVHADAPALGFGLLACMKVMKHGRPAREMGPMVVAAIWLALAVGSKQTMAPLCVILPAYVLMRWGWRPAMTLAGMTALLLAAGGFLCVAVWGYDAVKFNWFTIAAGQPWQFEERGRIVSFLIWTGTLISEATGPVIVMAMLALLFAINGPAVQSRRRVMHEAWFLPLAIAILMSPLAIMSIAKRGGWGNSLSVSVFFLVAAMGAFIARQKLVGDARVVRAIVGGAILLVLGLTAWSVTPFTNIRSTLKDIANLDQNPEQQAYEFAVKYPRAGYFPRNPLASLMAERQYYMFEFGLLDELQLGDAYRPKPERMLRHLPANMRIIAIPPQRTAGIAQMEMPGFTQPITVPELPKWSVFARPQQP